MFLTFSANKFLYNDKIVWFAFYPIVAISFIFFANDNPFFTLIRLPTFLTDLLFAIIVTFSIGFYIKWLTLHFDILLPWNKNFKKRLVKQFLFGIMLPLFFSMLLEIIYLLTINISLKDSSIFNLELPLAFLFLSLINLFYLVNYLFYSNKEIKNDMKVQTSIDTSQKSIEFIVVQKGFTEERINIEDCALLMSSNKIIWLYNFDGEKYRLQGTLEEWQLNLKEANFYRINRQYLVSLKSIKSIEQTETRKLKINLIINTDDVYVSKPNVTNFKLWWKNQSPL